jgi:hypothetical protein
MTRLEFKLALDCCRWSITGGRGSDLRDLASKVDWPTFVRLVRRHRIQGLVVQALRNNGVTVPAESEDISRDALAIAGRNLRSAVECARLLERFSDAGLRLIFVKGLTLSALAYRDPYVKLSCDIDILVDPGRIDRAAAILGDFGFDPVVPCVEPRSPDIVDWHARYKESTWYSREADLNLDLHTHLSDNAAVIPAVGLSSRQQWVSLGRGHKLPTLANDDLFAYLCVHGAVSAWFRLKWIVDLVAFLRNTARDRIQEYYRHALSAGAGRAPGQALLLADRLSLLELPLDLRTELRRDPMNRFLASLAHHTLIQPVEPTARPLGTAAIHISQLLLLPGWRFKRSEIARQGRQILWNRT